MEPQIIIARRIAHELKPGMLVNLGIGIPTLVANYVPEGIHVFFQSENGLIGTGTPPDVARGGCPGQRGANGGGSNGGASGGAVWLFANGTIDVRAGGGVRATGAGADGGQQANAGAGGGGSGGYLKLVAGTLKIDGTLAANGGGGGEGGNGINGGDSGGDGNLSATAANGGNSIASGGNGGNGSAGGQLDGSNASGAATSGGGGGGGAAGFIVLVGTRSGAGVVSPGAQ